MVSIAFPNMLGASNTNLVYDKDAVRSNLELLINVERKSLFGDPAFGLALKKVLFEQNGSIIVDLLIDELYTSIMTFIPQVVLDRKDIRIVCQGSSLVAQVRCTYRIDNTSDLFSIALMSE